VHLVLSATVHHCHETATAATAAAAVATAVTGAVGAATAAVTAAVTAATTAAGTVGASRLRPYPELVERVTYGGKL
jgi:hypothetical protein